MFQVVTAFSLLFSVLYVIWYRSDRPHHKAHGTSTIAVLGLFTTLVTTALVPVDVFLVSFMKNSDGTWKPWAEGEEVRESLKNSVLYAYYACYSLIFLFSFVIIPSNYFYHGLDVGLAEDDVEPSLSQKICHSFKYTLLSVFLFTILVISGIFLPFNGSPPSNSTEWQKIEWFFDELEANNGQDLLLFILNTLNIIGVSFLILYTGYGLSSLPCGLIRPTHGVRTRRTAVEIEIEDLERDIRAIEDRNSGGQVTGYEQTRLERLEQQVRLLRREHRDLDQRAKSLVSRCQLLMRPFQMVFGVIFSVFGFLLFLSLLLTNVDKALHSGGIYTGYALVNSTLPNPADMLLVFTQQVFPLDYILYSLMVLFLLSCSISGITNIGIRCLCLLVYRVRAWRTPPRGMLLAVLLLMFIILAQNVIMLSLVPDYTMFGNQHYIQDLPDGNISVNRCSAKNMPTMKVIRHNISSFIIPLLFVGRLCAIQNICAASVISLQGLDFRSSLLLVNLDSPCLCSVRLSILHVAHEVYLHSIWENNSFQFALSGHQQGLRLTRLSYLILMMRKLCSVKMSLQIILLTKNI